MSVSVSINIIDHEEGLKEIVKLNDVADINKLNYEDDDKQTEINIFDDGALIINRENDHITELSISNEAYVKITSEFGVLEIPIKVLAFTKKDDIVCMQYELDGNKKEIIIEYGEF